MVPGRTNSGDLACHRDCLTYDDLVANVRIEATEGANRYLVSPGDSIESVAALDSVVVRISWNFGGGSRCRPWWGNLIRCDLFGDRDRFGNSSVLGRRRFFRESQFLTDTEASGVGDLIGLHEGVHRRIVATSDGGKRITGLYGTGFHGFRVGG